MSVKRLPLEPMPAAWPSPFDILTIDQLNEWAHLDKTYLRHLCKTGELKHVTRGGADKQGKGHGFLVMRKDFLDWWEAQQKGPDPLVEAMRLVTNVAARNPFAKGGGTTAKAAGKRTSKLR